MHRLLWFVTAFMLCLSKSIVIQEDIQTETVSVEVIESQNIVRKIEVKTLERKCPYTDEEIELIALVTLAEAEGECEEGKRLVIDTILNRIGSSYFPDTVEDVIYQPYQFSSMWDDRYTRVTVTDDICDLVREEIYHRLNSEVIFFTANDYSEYGVPMFQVGNHCFSSYE